MNLPCQYLFTGSVFSCYQDVGICPCHFRYYFHQLQHGRRMSNQHFEPFFFVFLCLPFRRFHVIAVGFRHFIDQGLIIPWLQEEVGSSVFECFYGKFHVSVSSQHHYGQGRSHLPDMSQPIQPFVAIIDACREVHIQDDHVDAVGRQQGSDLIRVRSRQYLAEVVFKQKFE